MTQFSKEYKIVQVQNAKKVFKSKERNPIQKSGQSS